MLRGGCRTQRLLSLICEAPFQPPFNRLLQQEPELTPVPIPDMSAASAA